MEIIEDVINKYALEIALYALCTTFIITILVAKKVTKKNKYIAWKRDTINLYVFKREYERNDDELLIELFNENRRLDAELKMSKKQYTNLSILVVIVVFFIVLKDEIYKIFKKKVANTR
jgi:hypothetical protein